MGDAADLYETDFMLWAEQQAEALRTARAAGSNLALDWDNLAEEIESLARAQRRELRSRLETIIEHLLKLRFSTAVDPRSGWIDTVLRERSEVDALLDDNPSLGNEVGPIVAAMSAKVADRVARVLVNRGEAGQAVPAKLRVAEFGEAQVLGDWLPDPSTGEAAA